MATSIWDALVSLRSAVAWTPNATSSYMRSPRRIKLQDIHAAAPELAECFEVNSHCAWVSEKSHDWALRFGLHTSFPQTTSNSESEANSDTATTNNDAIPDLAQAGLLASLCFPLLDPTPLLLCTDLLCWLLLLQIRMSTLDPDHRSQLLADVSSIVGSDNNSPNTWSPSSGFHGGLSECVFSKSIAQP